MSEDRIANEIAHGKVLSEVGDGTLWYWASKSGQLRFKRRCDMIFSHIEEGMSVLEIGCGPGYFTKHLAKTKAQVKAIDISPDLLEYAKKNIKDPNVSFEVENAYKLKYPDSFFDGIVGSSVLHHLEVEKAFNEFDRVLKPGGFFIFTEPNMLNPHVYLERKVPFFTKMFHVSPDETAFIRWKLKKQMNKHGFAQITIFPFDFLHPLTPDFLIPLVRPLGLLVEKTPLLKEIAGSLYIEARKGYRPKK